MVQQESVTKLDNKIEIVYSDTIPTYVEPQSVRNSKEEVIATATKELNNLFGSEVAAEHYSLRVTYFEPKEYIRQNPEKFTDPESWRGGYSTDILDETGRKVDSSELAVRYYLVQQFGAEEAFKIKVEIKDNKIVLTNAKGEIIPNDIIKNLAK